jgi:type IV secretory pathway TrbD component
MVKRKQAIPADKARQGEIILRTSMRRAVFIAGLTAAVVLALVLLLWSRW